jgi:translocation and assembly module TamA
MSLVCRPAGVLRGWMLALLAVAWGMAPGWAQTAGESTASSTSDTRPKTEPQAAPDVPAAPTTTESAPIPRWRQPARWSLDIQAPDALKDLLTDYLDLARLQRETINGKPLDITRAELRRLVASIPGQAQALLDAEGYFAAQVRVVVEEPEASAAASAPQRVRVLVTPGARATVRDTRFFFEGALDQLLQDEDPATVALRDRIQSAWGLPPGATFTQSAWSSSKNSTLAQLRADGFPLATWSGTSATVDASQPSVRLLLVADSGPQFHFGDVEVRGLAYHSLGSVLNVAPFKPGERYQERMLLDWQERLQKLNLFENIFVSADPDPASPGVAPVRVTLRELPLQTATLGLGVSSDTGPRATVEHLHRNLLGLDWLGRSKAQWGSKESLLQVDLSSHPWPGRRRGLLSGEWSRTLDSFDSRNVSQRLRVGRLREGERLERTTYLEWLRSSVNDRDGELLADATALSLTSQWIVRRVDNQILPTQGYTALAQITGGRSYSALRDAGWFGRWYSRVNAYQPLGSDWHLSARAELGHVLAADEVSVPDTLLFRAGGDESVRGYAFRSLGLPVDGAVIGGRSLYTASVELAHPLPRLPKSFLGAVFVDVGDVANRFSDLSANTGYGLGLRWRSPVGALRLDMAYGSQVQSWRLHFSVGISL